MGWAGHRIHAVLLGAGAGVAGGGGEGRVQGGVQYGNYLVLLGCGGLGAGLKLAVEVLGARPVKREPKRLSEGEARSALWAPEGKMKRLAL